MKFANYSLEFLRHISGWRRISPVSQEIVADAFEIRRRLLCEVMTPRGEVVARWPPSLYPDAGKGGQTADAFSPTLAGMMNLIDQSTASGGLLLLLPLPIPFSETVPAWAVVLLTAGTKEIFECRFRPEPTGSRL